MQRGPGAGQCRFDALMRTFWNLNPARPRSAGNFGNPWLDPGWTSSCRRFPKKTLHQERGRPAEASAEAKHALLHSFTEINTARPAAFYRACAISNHFFAIPKLKEKYESSKAPCLCVCVCLSLSLYVSLSLSLCVSLCLCVFVCLSVSLSLSLCISLYLSLSPSVFSVFLYLSVCLWISLCLSVFLWVSLCLFLSVISLCLFFFVVSLYVFFLCRLSMCLFSLSSVFVLSVFVV